MASCDACKSGFSWDGKPTGTETTIAGNNTYVTGTSKSAAILIVHDIFGWTFTNLRVLADQFAKEANATVYLPDFFGGEVIPESTLTDPAKRAEVDVPAFLGKNSKAVRWSEIESAAKALKAEYPKLGAIGYCYGGWAITRLAAQKDLVDAVSTAHPSLLEKSEIDAVKVPLQFLAPETDQLFTPELKEYANKVIPTLGVPYEYVYFPGLVHGFATRGDRNNKLQKDGLERAKRSAVNFFNEFLH
ncbi:endo-1,3-1,4-beta-D-glucanase [Aaosphaeria arxii CBS 175.79]|uniref:Endo-1,3-1,4-beta-D-glucanase n=1 Tax=Aaosphaeria arxii CBS 175.79 TaxID=1450172 RepID=A0A6A5Y0M1_9PLEO|nr:endo-1,3-1,4-beta-D-glucanase [Aaosphaeria arxii CBS 175.79]KAF2018104.1 endo-1,3-1,4-beta-D-glucanase [Aaosphaeria arxii CBS 175.79]